MLVYEDGRHQGRDRMKRFALFVAGLGILVAGIVLRPGAAQGQAFPVAFKFSSQDGTRTNTFFQMGRDSFLEM
jgi:hypothetical protein